MYKNLPSKTTIALYFAQRNTLKKMPCVQINSVRICHEQRLLQFIIGHRDNDQMFVIFNFYDYLDISIQ